MHIWVVYLDLCRWRRRRPIRAVETTDVRDARVVPPDCLHAVVVRHEELDERRIRPGLLAKDRRELEAVVMLGVEVVRLAGAALLPPPEERAPHVERRLDRGNAMADACTNAACEPEARSDDLQKRKEYFAILRCVLSSMPLGFGRR